MLATFREKVSTFRQYLAASNKRTFTFAIIILALIALPLVVIASLNQQTLRQRASELVSPPFPSDSISLSISSSALTKNVGELFSTSVVIDAKEKNITGVDIIVTFNKDVLELMSFEKSPALANQLVNTIDNQKGELHYAATETASTQNTGTITLGTLNFKAKDKGTSPIGFQNVQITSLGESLPLPTEAVAGTITIADTVTPSPTPIAGSSNRVFVTSINYNGNLGGLTGADAKCQDRASAAKLGGTWKAWLSDNTTSAASRLAHSDAPYKLLNGAIVANNWSDLTDGKLLNTITITETDSFHGNYVWTGTNGKGEIHNPRGSKCQNWTALTNDSPTGPVGHSGYTDSRWSNDNGDYNCADTRPLYCFEQPSIPTPSPSPVVGGTRVFVTSNTYSGDLKSAGSKYGVGIAVDGLDGADKICQGTANTAKLGGTWKAWLSTYKIPASSRLNHSDNPYKLIDGTVIADNWSELTRGSGLKNPPNIDEYGNKKEDGQWVWTDTDENGNQAELSDPKAFRRAMDCKEWTSSEANNNTAMGGMGISSFTDYKWTKASGHNCDVVHALYCFEQSSSAPSPTLTPSGRPLVCGNYGDINGDGIISQIDNQMILDFIVKKINFSNEQKTVADLNGDSKVDVLDSIILSRYTVGSETTFPVCTSPTQIASTSAPILIKGDFNKDKFIDILDYQIWRDEFLGRTQTKRSDVNADGKINIIDFSAWRNAFNP